MKAPAALRPRPGRPARIAAVIVHWNQPSRCAETIARFRAQTCPADLLVVDNGSAPPLLDQLRKCLGEVPLLAMGRNTGFGPAANAGWRYWLERGEHRLLAVAPHDALPAPDCLERIVECFELRPTLGLASADVGDGLTPIVEPYLGGVYVPAAVGWGFEASGYAHGTLLVARRSCLRDVGLFDERFFAYGEEVDLGMRARARGWEVGIVRGARVHNPTMQAGSAAVDYLVYRNTLELVRRRSGSYHALMRTIMALLGLVLYQVRPATRPWLLAPRARLRGIFDFWRGRLGPPPAALFDAARPSPPDDHPRPTVRDSPSHSLPARAAG